MKPRRKNDCFAFQERRGKQKCRILLEASASEYMELGDCGNDGCPFYKPKGYEHTYVRGIRTRWLK
jgi:hypothetical protein